MKPVTSKILAAILTAALSVAAGWCTFTYFRYDDFWRYAKDTGLNRKEAVKLYGKPSEQTEWLMSMSNAAADEDWERLDNLTREDRHSEIGSYYRNLAKAMKGELSASLMDYYAPFERALFIPLNENTPQFAIAQSGEVWYQLGEMTMAEHGTILGLIFSEKQNGRRFLQRLGEINHIRGDEHAAEKYFHLTGKTSSLDNNQLIYKRFLLPIKDIVHSADNYRAALLHLVEANQGNIPAYEYLLCLDLLKKDLNAFLADFNPQMPVSRLYQEAGLICMASSGDYSEQAAARFGIVQTVFSEFRQFTEMYDHSSFEEIQERFGKTYWFYFKYAVRNEKNDAPVIQKCHK